MAFPKLPFSRLLHCLPVALTLSGCAAPTALDYTVMSYDQVTTNLLSQQLLLNIARARWHQPIHFTGVSNIAATLNFQANAGATPALTGASGGMILPTFGGSVSENPTITIIPIEGAEFTKRLLTPIPENSLSMLLRQGEDVDMVLRLVAGEFRETTNGLQPVYYNIPRDRGYSTFRKIVLHLSTIQDRDVLFVEPLRFSLSWSFPKDSITPEKLNELKKEFSVQLEPGGASYRLAKKVTGRVFITNYDPESLSNDERIRMNAWAESSPDDALLVDIRRGYTGGDYPIQGEFRLRSFHNIIDFLGRGIAEEREYDVPKDSRTPTVTENPIHTMEIVEHDSSPDNDGVSVSYNGYHYSIQPEQGHHWNSEAFVLLHQMFQMTMNELPKVGVPSLTIAK